MKKLTILSIAALGLLALAGSSKAQVISVQFNSTSLSSGTLTAGEVPESIWNSDTTTNSYVGAGTSSVSDLKDSTGTITGISENTINNGSYNQYHGLAFSDAGNTALFSTGDLGGFTAPTTFTLNLTGLSASNSYDLFLYVVGTADISEELSASDGTTTYYFDTATSSAGSNPASTFLQATSTSSSSPTAVADYVEFTEPAGSTSLSFTINPTGGQDFNVDGFQLETVAAAPEPSTWAMMLGGLGVLAFFVRRKGNLLS